MPVPLASAREALVRGGPVAHDIRTGPGAGGGQDGHPRDGRKWSALLISACVGAFLLGFAAVTFVMRDAESVTKRTKTIPTSAASGPAAVEAPAPSSPRTTVAPPPNALTADQDGATSPAPPPNPAPMPRTENAGGPPPSTTAPSPTTSATSAPTTMPTTTAP